MKDVPVIDVFSQVPDYMYPQDVKVKISPFQETYFNWTRFTLFFRIVDFLLLKSEP